MVLDPPKHTVLYFTRGLSLTELISTALTTWCENLGRLSLYLRFADKSGWPVGWQDSPFRAERVLYTNLAQG